MCYLDRFPVFRLGRQLCEEVDAATDSFTPGNAKLRDQLRRSVQSMLLNVGEGLGRIAPREKRRSYVIAHGEVHETRAALVLASLRRQVDSSQLARIDDLADHVGAQLWKLIRYFRE